MTAPYTNKMGPPSRTHQTQIRRVRRSVENSGRIGVIDGQILIVFLLLADEGCQLFLELRSERMVGEVGES